MLDNSRGGGAGAGRGGEPDSVKSLKEWKMGKANGGDHWSTGGCRGAGMWEQPGWRISKV